VRVVVDNDLIDALGRALGVRVIIIVNENLMTST
jgi:hypothetical protein